MAREIRAGVGCVRVYLEVFKRIVFLIPRADEIVSRVLKNQT